MRVSEATARPSACFSAGAEKFGRFFRIFGLAAATAIAALSSPAFAQPTQVVNQGQIVVTGYSGSVAVAPPEGADPFDYLRIKLDGPSVRVVDVRILGPQGQLSSVTKPFTAVAGQMGQVLGVALDNAPQPNIYVAATSAYGLAIAIADPSGQPKRVRKGEPGAQWMPGQFGPPGLGGGPGSIWRIDGITGAVALFANIDTAAFGAASLGGLAFDPTTRQIFAVDRGTGLIHRFSLDGVQRGVYDHGTEGRGPAGLPPIPSPGFFPINIQSAAFDTENPATWGFAAPARRVYAVGVRGNRLYYTVQQQVWSVGISPSGAVAASPRVEVEVPALQDGIEIASIAFDGQGRMYLAERGATTGDYFRYTLANGGAARVLRYIPKTPGDPSPGLWRLAPEQYSVGMTPIHANGNGGVALGYGYRQDNVIDFNACRTTVWSTGERLLDPGNPAVPPDSYPHVDGLQGNAASLVQPQNTPPSQSWFIDYDDLNGDPNYRGHMGAVAILPCPGVPTLPPPPPPPPPPVTCPPGTYFHNGQCVIIPTCPPGTFYQNGQCYYDQCPPGLVQLPNGQCVPPPVSCPPGTVYYQGQCYPIACPPGLVKQPNGQCSCPPGNVWFNGQCVPPQNCPPTMIELPGGICWCPLGTIFGNGFCQPSDCPPGNIMENGFCKPCPAGKEVWNNQCKPKCAANEFRAPDGTCKPLGFCFPPNEVWNGLCVPKCGIGEIHQPPNGACAPGDIVGPCAPNQVLWNGVCKPKCALNEFRDDEGNCKPFALCVNPNEIWNGLCVPKCGPAEQHLPPDGACGPGLSIFCLFPKVPFNGVCVDPCPAGQVRKPDGTCGPDISIFCIFPKVPFNGECVDPCPPNQVRKPDGTCGFGFKLPDVIGPLVPDLPLAPACAANEELVDGACKPKCVPPQVRKPDGTCGLGFKLPDVIGPIVPPIIQPLPLPPGPLPPPPDPIPPPGPGPGPFPPDFKLPGLQLPGVLLPELGTPPAPPPPEEPPPVVNPGLTLPGLLPGLIVKPPETGTPPAGGTPPLQVNPQLTLPPGTLKLAPGTVTPTPETQTETPPTVNPELQLILPPGQLTPVQ